jgi:quercetin dioxygenase-like cupin family protein
MSVVRRLSDIKKKAHPFLPNVTIQTLFSNKDDDADITCFIVRCKVGSEIEEHIHAEESDIIFVLEGLATMWVEDLGSFTLEPGIFVVVPKGLRHRTYDVKEDVLIYDIFTPPMF